jgi:pimeloyl-ACP methyl ester carboxylesterase
MRARPQRDGDRADSAFDGYIDAIVAAIPDRLAERARPTRAGSLHAGIYGLLKKPLFAKYMVGWQWPSGVDRRPWERVDIPSRSGALLAGLFACAHGRSKGVVVCAHPMRRSAKGYFLASGRAEMLRRHGYDVLLFDFNGFGESPQGNFNYPLDVLAAGEFARRIAGGLPVHVVAASFGAGWSICAATREHPFESLVLECPFTTPQEFYARFPWGRFALDVLWQFFPKTRATMIPLESAERIAGDPRMLFIGCLADTTTAPAMTRRLFDRCSLRRERRGVWFADRAGHIRAFEADPDGFERRVTRFLDGVAEPIVAPAVHEESEGARASNVA